MARWVLPTPGGPQQEDVGGLGDEGQVGQFLDQPLVDGGLEGEVELLKGTLERQMGPAEYEW